MHTYANNTKKSLIFLSAIFGDPLVIRTRFERVTVCLEGRCSIQLSYRTDFRVQS